MHICPHCQQETISNFRKITSVSFYPATCSACNEQSYTHIIFALSALSAWIIITWVLIALSYTSRASIFLLGTIPALVLVIDKFLLKSPLIAKAKQQ